VAASPAQAGPVVTWVPRPPHPDEPVCWSWPVPPLRDRDEEVQRQLAAQVGLRIDDTCDEGTLRMLMYDMAVYRFHEFHDNRCAVCGRRRDDLVIDHCHETGQWRGELCRRCNTHEGRALNPWPAVVRYQEIHPAAILDLHEPFTGTGWTSGWCWREVGDPRRLGRRPATPWPAWSLAAAVPAQRVPGTPEAKVI
jgi:Recombination endonuclease VII